MDAIYRSEQSGQLSAILQSLRPRSQNVGSFLPTGVARTVVAAAARTRRGAWKRIVVVLPMLLMMLLMLTAGMVGFIYSAPGIPAHVPPTATPVFPPYLGFSYSTGLGPIPKGSHRKALVQEAKKPSPLRMHHPNRYITGLQAKQPTQHNTNTALPPPRCKNKFYTSRRHSSLSRTRNSPSTPPTPPLPPSPPPQKESSFKKKNLRPRPIHSTQISRRYLTCEAGGWIDACLGRG